MEINKLQAQFILDAIKARPVQVTWGQIMDGVNVSDDVKSLISSLEEIVKNETKEETKEAPTETTEETKVVEAEVVN